MPSKGCMKCGVIKPLSEYYKHSQMADGHLNKCKECTRRENLANRDSKIEYYRNYDKQRMNDPNRVACREAFANSEAGKLTHRKAVKTYRNKNKLVRRAWSKVQYAILTGRLIRPEKCSNCEATERIEAHHCDYTKPLDVIWFCPRCHADWHLVNEPKYV